MTQEHLINYANGYYWAFVFDKWQPISLQHVELDNKRLVLAYYTGEEDYDLGQKIEKLGLYLDASNPYLKLDKELVVCDPNCRWPECGCQVETLLFCPYKTQKIDPITTIAIVCPSCAKPKQLVPSCDCHPIYQEMPNETTNN